MYEVGSQTSCVQRDVANAVGTAMGQSGVDTDQDIVLLEIRSDSGSISKL